LISCPTICWAACWWLPQLTALAALTCALGEQGVGIILQPLQPSCVPPQLALLPFSCCPWLTHPLAGLLLACRKALSQVCQRWRDLCFSAPELWQTVQLRAPSNEPSPDERQQWLDGKLWLLQVRLA